MRRTLASLLFITTIALALPATAAPVRPQTNTREHVARNQDDNGPGPIARLFQKLGKTIKDANPTKDPVQ
jgi:hypothetical protein